MEVEFVDRYTAAGTLPPNRWTGCGGRCEGLGVHPMPFTEWAEWNEMPERPKLCPQKDENDVWEPFPPKDESEWIFVYCASCEGTGRRVGGLLGRTLDAIHTYYYPFVMACFAYQNRDFFKDSSRRTGVREALRLFGVTWREQSAHRAARAQA